MKPLITKRLRDLFSVYDDGPFVINSELVFVAAHDVLRVSAGIQRAVAKSAASLGAREVNITCHGRTSILFYLPKRDLQLPTESTRDDGFSSRALRCVLRFCWCSAVQKLQSRFWQSSSHLLLPVFLLCARTALIFFYSVGSITTTLKTSQNPPTLPPTEICY